MQQHRKKNRKKRDTFSFAGGMVRRHEKTAFIVGVKQREKKRKNERQNLTGFRLSSENKNQKSALLGTRENQHQTGCPGVRHKLRNEFVLAHIGEHGLGQRKDIAESPLVIA